MSYSDTSQRLSICLRINGFSFSLLADGNKLMNLADVPLAPVGAGGGADMVAQIMSCLDAQGVKALSLGKMQLTIPTRVFTWIPASLFDSSRCKQYLALVARPEAIEEVYHIYNPAIDAYMVFSADARMVTAFKVALPGIDVHCQHSMLVTESLLRRSDSHPLMLLHVDEGRADIEAFYSGKLLLSNSYSIGKPDESLFFAINVMKGLHLETPDMELAICGAVDRAFYAVCQRFFPNVSLHTGPQILPSDPTQQPVPTYKYPLLFN